MSILSATDAHKTPWHLWVIGGVSLLWNAFGALDYVMTQTRHAGYMSAFSEEQLAFFYGMPAWVDGAWAIAVWGGVLGSICLLLRRRLAVLVFLLSFLAMALTMGHNYLLADGLAVMGDAFSLAFTAAIVLIAAFLFAYAGAMSSRNLLR